MSRMIHLAALGIVGLLFTGCVSGEKYNALKLDNASKAQALADAQNQLNVERARSEALQHQIDAVSSTGSSKDAMITNLTQDNSTLQGQLQKLNEMYQAALNRPNMGGPLPERLSNELTSFAQANPDLVEFDPSMGIVKFKSDVTFATGEAELTPKASDVISRFATILNSADAAQYELLVAGHTDNSPVMNPATIANGHKDNWYLSAHRAIAVGEALMHQRVSPSRIGVVGYAEQRPVAPNTTAAGKAQNRRVEVLILPTTVRGPAVPTATDISSGHSRVVARPAASPPRLNKDSGILVDRPLPNK